MPPVVHYAAGFPGVIDGWIVLSQVCRIPNIQRGTQARRKPYNSTTMSPLKAGVRQ